MATSWQVSVVHGKETFVVAMDAAHPQRVAQLKQQIAVRTGIAPVYQRLLYRGKELQDAADKATSSKPKKPQAPPLVDNAKIMLLFTQAYHQDAAKAKSPAASTVASDEPATTSSVSTDAPMVAPKSIDLDALEDDQVLIQVLRGKSNYEMILKRDETVLTAKTRVGDILGLVPSALRLVVKGKTPADETLLSDLMTTSSSSSQTRPIKLMALLQAQQHVVMEKEDDLRLLLNELTQLQVEAQRAAKQLARNFLSREESAIMTAGLRDGTQRVKGNLNLLCEHLMPSGVNAAARPQANKQTRDALTRALQDMDTLCSFVETLLDRQQTRFD
ncbi:Dead-box atp-dependent RNA helicase 5, partial [Globisporangium splendens]